MDMQVKIELEELRDGKFRTKTHSDTIEKLIQYYVSSERQKVEAQEEKEKEKKRREAEDVYLGAELKTALTKFQEHLKFRSPADAIEFLKEAFDLAPQIDRMAFDLYVLKARR
jgi:hypothetical protein